MLNRPIGLLWAGAWHYAATLGTLWLVDVVVNLRLLNRLFLYEDYLWYGRTFAGLALAEAPVALVVTVLAAGVGLAAACVFRHGSFAESFGAEWAAALIAGVTSLAVLSQLRASWGFSRSNLVWAMALALVVALPSWQVSRSSLRRHGRHGPSGPRVTFLMALAALSVGLISLVAFFVVEGDWTKAAGHLAVLLAVFALGLAGLRSRRRLVTSCCHGALHAAAMLLVVAACFDSARYTGSSRQIASATTEAGASAKGPDVILIVLDTFRADHLQSYGYDRNTMPALERWAAEAILGKQVVSTAGWTSPAHASIFSGKSVSQHGVHYGRAAFFTPPFESVVWLPRIFAESGYRTVAVSANSMAVRYAELGFEQLLAPRRADIANTTIAGLVDHYYPIWPELSGGLRWRMPYVDARELARLVSRVAVPTEAPLFLFVNFLDAHSPYNPPRSTVEQFGAPPLRPFSAYATHRELTRQWSTLPDGKQQALIDLYDGELRWIDQQLEWLLPQLERRFPEAMIIVTADHGEELGEEGRVGHEWGLSQALIHVPFFLKIPGAARFDLEGPVSLRRLFALLENVAVGRGPTLESLGDGDGRVIVSERYPSSENARDLGSEYDRPWISLIEDRIKVIGPAAFGLEAHEVRPESFGTEGPLRPAPDSLRDELETSWQEFRDRREETTGVDPADLERLRSLGYVG